MKKEKKTELLQGTLELLILRLLQSGPLNGWDIMQRIGLVSGEVIKVSAGSLYPALHVEIMTSCCTFRWDTIDIQRD